MKTKIIKIGNSQGIRIPKVLLEQSRLPAEVELEVHDQQIIIKPAVPPRQGWDRAFQAMAAHQDDQLLDGEALPQQASWDAVEWEW